MRGHSWAAYVLIGFLSQIDECLFYLNFLFLVDECFLILRYVHFGFLNFYVRPWCCFQNYLL